MHCTEVHFASFLSGGFTTMAVINPPERKLVKRTSVQSTVSNFTVFFIVLGIFIFASGFKVAIATLHNLSFSDSSIF